MSLFTADGILVAETKLSMGGIGGDPRCYVANSYMDWLLTQEQSFDKVQRMPPKSREKHISWLLDVPEIYSRKAPGNTCISAFKGGSPGRMNDPKNNSKGCGGIMRVAPLGLWHNFHGELYVHPIYLTFWKR